MLNVPPFIHIVQIFWGLSTNIQVFLSLFKWSLPEASDPDSENPN